MIMTMNAKSCLKQERSPTTPKKKVAFNQIQMCEHCCILGDNPTPLGIPITIEWKSQSITLLDVEKYELSRNDYENRRRTKSQLKLSPQRRTELAMLGGSHVDDIVKTFSTPPPRKKARQTTRRSHQKSQYELLRQGMDNPSSLKEALFTIDGSNSGMAKRRKPRGGANAPNSTNNNKRPPAPSTTTSNHKDLNVSSLLGGASSYAAAEPPHPVAPPVTGCATTAAA
jgi:hypothetical protein